MPFTFKSVTVIQICRSVLCVVQTIFRDNVITPPPPPPFASLRAWGYLKAPDRSSERMAPYSVPLFASPSKTDGRPNSGAALLGGLRQPLTPDAFERLPQLLTAASSDEEDGAYDALAWRGGLHRDDIQRMSATAERPSWDAEALAGSKNISFPHPGRPQAAADRHLPASGKQQQDEAPVAAVHRQSAQQPATQQLDMMHGGFAEGEAVYVLESAVVQQAVLAMQVR